MYDLCHLRAKIVPYVKKSETDFYYCDIRCPWMNSKSLMRDIGSHCTDIICHYRKN